MSVHKKNNREKLLRNLNAIGLAIGLSVGTHACSSADSDEQELEQTSDNQENENQENENQDNNEENQQNNQDENYDEEESAENDENYNDTNELAGNDTSTMEAEMNTVADNEGSANFENGDAMSSPMGSGTSDPSGRIVRFIRSPSTQVHAQPDAGSSTVSTMNQGDSVMVTMEGAWAMIGEGRYVSASDLSDGSVPRSRTSNDWN